MSTTYLELTNKVLRLLNEVELTSSNFSTANGLHATVRDAVGYSINHINNEEYTWPFNFEEEQSVTLSVGENHYSFESDYKVADWESFFIFNDGTLTNRTQNLNKINVEEWQRYGREKDYDNLTAGIDVPRFVFPYGNNKFGVTEVPDKAYTLKYDYWKLPTQLVNHDDATTIPPMWDYVITLGAIWYGDLFKSDDSSADRREEKFTNGIDRMRSILINDDKDVTSGMINLGQVQSQRRAFEVGS